jgi:hypothetical protein
MAKVRRIETAAKESDALAAVGLVHAIILPRATLEAS